MNFDYFVLPFTIGLMILLSILAYTFIRWIVDIEKTERRKIGENLLTKKTLVSIREVFMESLLHRKIIKTNPMLGYMHMSFAFGWFLLILVGDLEVKMFNPEGFVGPYYMVFFRFFQPNPHIFPGSLFFSQIMDFLLLFILSGLVLAIIKRFRSKPYGLKKTTKLRLGDKLALITLWSIFPLRLLAESFTSGLHQSGGFLTGNLGYAFSTFLPLNYLEYGTWWLYSLALGLFFVVLPFSRYMHIPTEVLLIFLRNYGIHTQKYYSSISEVEVYSCSRCGICLDSCQLQDADIISPISVYFLRSVRNNSLDSQTAFNCALCGRCNEVCPVGIDITAIRSAKREHFNLRNKFTYDFPKPQIPSKTKVIYFAGCMTHLTPSIQKSMFRIFKAAGDDFWFMDEEKGVCCGRPLMMAGQHNAALQLINHNRSIINKANADILVTSCPICHKVFSQKYNLSGIKVMHHTEYIDMLIQNKRITLDKLPLTAVYHDPCELGRGSNIYEQPRNVLKGIVHLRTSSQERQKSLCCGGSLGNFEIESKQRDMIRDAALDVLLEKKPDVLVTACPLCKKTFGKNTDIKVHDISELVAQSITEKEQLHYKTSIFTS